MLMQLTQEGAFYLDPRSVRSFGFSECDNDHSLITLWDTTIIRVCERPDQVAQKYETAMKQMRILLGEPAMRIPGA